MSTSEFPSSQVLVQAQMAASEYAMRKARALSRRLTAAGVMTHIWPDFFQPMTFKNLKGEGFRLHPVVGTEFDVINRRNAYFLSQHPTKVQFDQEVAFHRLRDDKDSMLTSDLPIERYQQYLAFSKMRGHVLMTGLGMGMAAWMCLEMLPQVLSVTVVEKEKALIDFIEPQLPPDPQRLAIIHADAYEFLKTVKPGQYQSAYHDIWYSTGEATWAEHVVPLYRLSRKIRIKNLGAWGEFEMISQLRSALHIRSHLVLPEEKFKPYRVFRQALKDRFGTEPPYPGQDKVLEQMIESYLTHVGAPSWEYMFKWDDQKEGADEA